MRNTGNSGQSSFLQGKYRKMKNSFTPILDMRLLTIRRSKTSYHIFLEIFQEIHTVSSRITARGGYLIPDLLGGAVIRGGAVI